MLYRLAVSPGTRSLRGMESRRGRLVRPLLEVTREEVREYLRARYLQWREDPSNADRRFARARVRHEVITALRQLNPKAEQTIAETARQLREEAEILDISSRTRWRRWAVARRCRSPRSPAAGGLRRLVLRRLAEWPSAGRARSRAGRPRDAALGRARHEERWTSAAA